MESTRLMNHVNVACDWVIKLLYLNLLWILFTVTGLVVAGIFPATVALFTVLKDLQTSKNVRVFTAFRRAFREGFGKANQLGVILTLIPIIFYTDWLFTGHLSSSLEVTVKGILVGCTCLYGITLLYVFPVYLQTEKKVFSSLKTAFLIGITYPFYTFSMIISISSLLVLYAFLPMAGYLFFASGLAFILLFFSLRLFQKIELQRSKVQKHRRAGGIIHN